jgi:hypothetical protein
MPLVVRMILENRKYLSLSAVKPRTLQTHYNILASFQFKAVDNVKSFEFYVLLNCIMKYACNKTNLMHYFQFIESLNLYVFRV